MRKMICCILVFAMILASSFTAFAAQKDGFTYSGESYWATNKYGVNFRDAYGKKITYIPRKSTMYVLGISKDEPNRAVIEWEGKIGTVLKGGLVKQATSNEGKQDEFNYSGESYWATNKYGVNLRDVHGKFITYIPRKSTMHVLGISKDEPKRAVIEWEGKVGTVLKGGLLKLSSDKEQFEYSGEAYWSVNKYGLNLRDTDKQIIQCIPANSLIEVKGIYKNDHSRSVVVYNGIEGTVLTSGLKKVEDAIFVNIDLQTVKLFKNGKLIAESKCVTGLLNVKDTPKGAFEINYMEEKRVLRGNNLDGTKYAQPVDYWMHFFNGCGFHDATWRSSFGGEIYKKNGSHGCVNLPYSFAKKLYENACVGMPVYVV